MGDPVFVEGLVRKMLEEVRRLLWGLDDPNLSFRTELPKLGERWIKVFSARNPDFVQTMTPEAQQVWLQNHGLAKDDPDELAPINCLLANTIGRFADACMRLEEGQMKEEQAQFWIATAIEDCTCLLLGVENYAD